MSTCFARSTTARPGSPGAFTLIELLVVIAVIAVLASLIFPAVRKALATSRSAACKSNLHQMGQIFGTYTSDHDGKLPPTGFYGVTPYYNRDMRHMINYLRNYCRLPESGTWSASDFSLMEYAPLFDCPCFKGSHGGKCYELRGDIVVSPGSTARPFGMVGSANGQISIKPLRDTDVREPAQEWALKDDISWTTTPAPSHDSYRNALFFDWHVGALDLNNARL